MQAKTSDILDRFTILRMKKRFDNRVEREYKELEQEVLQNILMPAGAKTHESMIKTQELILLLLDLMESNAKTWEQEAAIRKELPDDPSNTSISDSELSEIGKRALIIRKHNKLRLKAKAEIDKIFGQLSDVKVDHVSS